MKDEAVILFQVVKQTYKDLVPLIERLKRLHLEDAVNLNDHADTALSCRDSKTILDEIKKEISALESMVAKAGCMGLQIVGRPNIKTDHGTYSPNPRQWFKIPHKREGREEQFDEVMKALGIPEEVYLNEVIRLHPPNATDYFTQLQDKAPVNTDDIISTEFRFRITKKKEVDE